MLRDESIVESAKQRSLRVPLDHYKRSPSLVRAKYVFSVVTAAIAIAYVGWLLFGGRAATGQASPGPVAAVHQAWNDDCHACHRDFQPLRGDSLSVAALFSGHSTNRESLDQACIKCHDEPAHHAAAKADEVPNCAACHQEHQGSAADIVRPSDTTCVRCHRDIEHRRNGPSGLSPPFANVWGFGATGKDTPHPEFRSLGNDPGNVKFNHWLHMQPGLAAADAKRKLMLSDLDAHDQPKYSRDAKSADLVVLTCAACHEPQPAGGAYMQPVAYEQHCRACHPLQLPLANGQPPAEIPHGLSAQRLASFINGLLFSAEQHRLESPPITADESGAAPLVPGKTLGNNLAQKINRDLLGRFTGAARSIATKCQQCHYTRSPSSGDNAELTDVLPAHIPAVWLRHARFDHRAHRHVECRDCHQSVFAFQQRFKPQFIVPPDGGTPARDDQQVMIAGMESCVKCHTVSRATNGGARHDCAECHNYHGGDATVRQVSSLPLHSPQPSSPGSSLGTHDPKAPASSEPAIRLATFTALDSPSPTFVGASSCASAGCHGEVRPGAPTWQTAFTTWATSDPHARAYDVLWTFRAREMTRLLGPRKNDASEPPALSDQYHRAILKDRCLGCHATPSSQADSAAQDHSLGVHCESCHGPAAGWLHAHDRIGFVRGSAAGFTDAKDLTQQAGACMPCHVGPSHAAGTSQIVDHDLIAAGHPRLAFEFRSYLESLPAHWDRKADEARYPGEFHFRSWIAGQHQQAEQRKLLNRDNPTDFAQLDCFACHHQLRSPAWRQEFSPATLVLPDWPRLNLPPLAGPALPVAQRLALARALLHEAATTDLRWDAALQSYFAARAAAADLLPQSSPQASKPIAELNSALDNLGNYLAIDSFSSRDQNNFPRTLYDSPTNFAPEALTRRVKPVNDALQQLQAIVGSR